MRMVSLCSCARTVTISYHIQHLAVEETIWWNAIRAMSMCVMNVWRTALRVCQNALFVMGTLILTVIARFVSTALTKKKVCVYFSGRFATAVFLQGLVKT